MSGPSVPGEVADRVEGYLRGLDVALPGRVVGFHLAGSVALGAYREGRSDLDYVAVVDGPLTGRELARLRRFARAQFAGAAARAIGRRAWALPGVFNGVYVEQASLAQPVTTIVPVASHTASAFRVGVAFDVNPVVWKVLVDRGVTVRGDPVTSLALDPEPAQLRAWTLDNLQGYWATWGQRTALLRNHPARLLPRWSTAWGVLGAPRLHHTIATGEVISKEAAGEYALDTFASPWHPLLREALAYWRDEPADPTFAADVRYRLRLTGRFVLEVVRAGTALGPLPAPSPRT